MSLTPLITGKDQQPAYWVVGDRYTVLLSAEDTGGQFSMFEFVVPPGRGSPPHIHHREDETFHLLEGEVEFMVDGAVHRVGPGATVFGARGVVHNFRNIGTTDARMVVLTTPGGLERFFAEAGVPAGDRVSRPPEPTQADKARMIETAPKYGLELVLPTGHH